MPPGTNEIDLVAPSVWGPPPRTNLVRIEQKRTEKNTNKKKKKIRSLITQ